MANKHRKWTPRRWSSRTCELNHSEIPPHTYLDGRVKKTDNAGCWQPDRSFAEENIQCSRLLMPLSQQARKGVAVLAGVTDPDQPGGHCTPPPQWREGRVCLQYRTSPLLVWPCPVISVNGNLQRHNSGRTANGPEPSGMKAGSPTPATTCDQLQKQWLSLSWVLPPYCVCMCIKQTPLLSSPCYALTQ